MLPAGRHQHVVQRRQVQGQPRGAGAQAVQPRRQLRQPQQPETGRGGEGARPPALADRRLAIHAGGEQAVDERQRQPPSSRHVQQPAPQAARMGQGPARMTAQLQSQQQPLERQIPLLAEGGPALLGVQGEVPIVLGDDWRVVAQRPAGVAGRDEVAAAAREHAPPGQPRGGGDLVGHLDQGIDQAHEHLPRSPGGAGVQNPHLPPYLLGRALARQQAQEADQAFERGKAQQQFLAHGHPAGVGGETRQVEAHLADGDAGDHVGR